MPLPQEQRVANLHQQISNNLAEFAHMMSQFASTSEIRSALEHAPRAVTKGRNFMQIVMDDLLDVFEDMVVDLKKAEPGFDDNAIPVEIYQQIMKARDGTRVTRKDAKDQLDANVAGKLAMQSVTPKPIPDFLSLIQESAPLGVVNNMGAYWQQAVQEFGQLFLNEPAVITNSFITAHSYEFGSTFNEWLQEKAQKMNQQGGNRKDKSANADALASAGVDPMLAKFLGHFGDDLTATAAEENAPKIYGRDDEVGQLMSAVIKKDTPFAILTGKTGVGKSAVAQALAERIVEGQVPEELKDAKIIRLKLRELDAASGQSQKQDPLTGQPMAYQQFTDRMHYILNAVEAHNAKGGAQIILDIDELDDMAERFSALGAAKEILASAVANNKHLRLIGEISDTHFSQLTTTAPKLLHDFKQIKIAPLDRKFVEMKLKDEAAALKNEKNIDVDPSMFDRIINIGNRYMAKKGQPNASVDILRTAAAFARTKGSNEVTLEHIGEVVSRETSIPKDAIMVSMQEKIANLRESLPKTVVGQPDIQKIIDKLEVSNNGIRNRRDHKQKPMGSFLMVGNTGVGKTYTGKALAKELGIKFHRIDMTNYMQEHNVSQLIGAPPGYVGYDNETKLEETVGKTPYCVLMLDEIEKAHPDVFKVLLPALEEGEMQLANGKTLDLSNTIILMSSNLGTKEAAEAKKQGGMGLSPTDHDSTALSEAEMMAKVEQVLAPEFRNRVDDILIFKDLTRDLVKKIALKEVEEVSAALRDANKNLTLDLSDEALEELLDIGFDPAFGARPMAKAVEKAIEMPVTRWFDENAASITEPTTIHVTSLKDEFNFELIKKPGNDNDKKQKGPGPNPAPTPRFG